VLVFDLIRKIGKMRSLGAKLIFWAILSAAVMARGIPTSLCAQSGPQAKARGKASSMGGCIDGDSGRHFLVGARDCEPTADLEADGFPAEGFAKQLGQTVIVREIFNPGKTQPRIKVRGIETTPARQNHRCNV